MLTASFVGRLLVRLRLRWACAPVLAACLFAFGANVFLDEQTLTGEQEAQLLPGRYDASASLLGLDVPVGSPYLSDIQERLDAQHLPVTVSLQVIDFPAYSLRDDGIYLRELDWTEDPFPGVHALIDGRWPTRPGEVAVVAPEVSEEAAVGDRLKVPGAAEPLEVVGLVMPRLNDDPALLAAPGTLAGLGQGPRSLNTNLVSSPTFFFAQPPDRALVEDLAGVLSDVDPEVFRLDSGTLADAIHRSMHTRADAFAGVERPWTERSPMLYRLPVLVLVPLSVLLCLFGLGRQLRPALRMMVMHGMRRRTAVSVGMGVVAVASLSAGLAGAGGGMLLGHLAAQVDAWSVPAAQWRSPQEAPLAVGAGLLVGLGAAALVLARERRTLPRIRGPVAPWIRHARHGLATITACYAIVLVPSLDTAADALRLTAVTSVLATLLAPDLLSWLVARLGSARLLTRLIARSMQASGARHATTAMALTLGFCVCAGVLTATATVLEVQRRHVSPPALPGQVILDGDGSTLEPVDPAVLRAVREIGAIADQEPVQFYAPGKMGPIPGADGPGFTDSLEIRGASGLVVAFDTVEDLERAAGRSLTGRERESLTGAGVLVVDESVPVTSGRIDLTDEAGTTVATGVRAVVGDEMEPSPWLHAVDGITLTGTVKALGWPLVAGALIYTDVPDKDAEAVLEALVDNGISPEQATIHLPPPALVPPAALSGLCAALFLVVLLLAFVAVRGQVALMRPWASRLTQLGVRRAWAGSVLRRQFLLVAMTAAPLGVVAGLGPFLFARLLVPRMPVVVPWEPIVALTLTLAAAMTAAAWLSTRSLSAQEALGWTDPIE